MSEKVCAIITAYYPEVSILAHIKKLEPQVSLIVITDNTPNVDNTELFKGCTKIVYQANKSNLGLSAAFNACLKLEAVKSSDFILFLDQDSLVPENLVEKLIIDYNALLKEEVQVGCIGAVYYEKNAGKLMMPKIKHKLLHSIYKVDAIITSSMLTTYNTLSKINFWNEEIFLDLADWDLCWRLRQIGFACCLTENVVLEHTLGKSAKWVLGMTLKCAVPVRVYYQIRDGLKLLIKPYTPLRYKIRFLLNIFVRPALHFIFWDKKTERLKYLFYGIFDFFCSRQGSWESRRWEQYND